MDYYNSIEITDSNGIVYPSLSEFCRVKGIPFSTLWSRMNEHPDWGVDYFIGGLEVRSVHMVSDHLGNVFSNEVEMCRFHSVNIETFRQRRKRYPSQPVEYYLTGNKSLRVE